MRRLPWIALGLAIIALVLVAIPLQSRLRVLQHELGTTNRQLVQARAASAELERVNARLKTELDAVSKARTQLQGHLDEANTKAEQLGKDLNTAQSQLKEKEVHEQELTTELEKTKKETYAQLAAAKEANQRQFETITNEATKKLAESEKRVADLTDQLKSTRPYASWTQDFTIKAANAWEMLICMHVH